MRQVARSTGRLTLDPKITMEDWFKRVFMNPLGDPLFRSRHEHGPLVSTVTDKPIYDAWCSQIAIRQVPWALAACLALDEECQSLSPHLSYTITADAHKSLHEMLLAHKIHSGQTYLVDVEIDLSGTDEVLIADFKKWLAVKRKDSRILQSSIKKFTSSDFREWSQKRALAYIDLQMASAYFDSKLSYHRAGCLLFPDMDDLDLAEKVRKGTRLTADYLMTWECVNALYAQANADRAQKAE